MSCQVCGLALFGNLMRTDPPNCFDHYVHETCFVSKEAPFQCQICQAEASGTIAGVGKAIIFPQVPGAKAFLARLPTNPPPVHKNTTSTAVQTSPKKTQVNVILGGRTAANTSSNNQPLRPSVNDVHLPVEVNAQQPLQPCLGPPPNLPPIKPPGHVPAEEAMRRRWKEPFEPERQGIRPPQNLPPVNAPGHVPAEEAMRRRWQEPFDPERRRIVFNCNVCNKKCNSRQNLHMHKLIHEHPEGFTCPHCPQKFTLKNNMQKHIRNLHK